MKTKIISYNLSYGFRHQNHTEKILVPIFLSAGPLGQRTTSQFIEDMHSSAPSVSGTSTLACRLQNLPHGDILCHPSWPSVSGTFVPTCVTNTHIRLWHIRFRHLSWEFRFGDLRVGLLFQGHRSDHPSWLSDSGTSGSTFRFRDIGLHYPFRRTVLAVRLVAISVGISLGDIRLCLQSQDQLISFNPHSKGSSTNYYRLINFNRTH